MPFRWRFHDPEDAFWNKVDRSSGEDACWIWLKAVDSNGYGALKVRGKKSMHTVTPMNCTTDQFLMEC